VLIAFSLIFSVLVMLVHLQLHLSPVGRFLREVVTLARATSGIRASQVRRGIVCWVRRHQLLFGGDRVSISKRHSDWLWDCVLISKQRVDYSRIQFEGVDCFENSSRVSREGKDPIFI